jgi:hypothetical protein
MIPKNRLFLVVLVAFLAIGFGTVSAGTCPCSKPGTGVPSPVTTPSTLPAPLPTPMSSLPEFTITAIPDQNGVLAPAGLVKVAAGSSQQFFIIPLPGYKIDRVIVDGVNKGSVNMYTFDDVQADHALHAYFIEENQSSHVISLRLDPGWNFISTPKSLEQGFDTVDSVLGSTDTANHSVYLYDASTSRWISLEKTSKIMPLDGIWVYSGSSTIIDFMLNDINEKPSKSIYPGWNAVGCTGLDVKSVKENFISIDPIWTSTIGFNVLDQIYETSLINGGSGSHSDATVIIPGKGYWVHSTSTGTLIEN